MGGAGFGRERCVGENRLKIMGLAMMKSRTMGRACRAPAGIALGALCVLALSAIAASPVRAEDGDSGVFGTVMRNLGIGGDKTIEYRDRPPLQVPQTRDLPPPGSAAPARAPAGAPIVRSDRMNELDKLAVPQRAATPTGVDATGTVPPSDQASSPGFFGRMFNGGSKQEPTVQVAPSRNTLLQPPPDYQTASPDAPYGGDGKENSNKRSSSDRPVPSGQAQ
jgi:hypothetical protein